MSEPYLTVKNLSLSFPKGINGHSHILKDVNFTLNKGEFLVLLGPSGCGKSTLLRTIAGLSKEKHQGSILFEKDYDNSKTSFVFQDFGLLPWLSIKENVALSLVGRNVPKSVQEQKVSAILGKLGLHGFENHRPHQLSGGMKQRVGIARALVTDPELILLDEPFSELDFFTATKLRNELLELWQETKATIIMVSHYVEEAVCLADHIAVFSDRPGTIKNIMKNDLPRPRNIREPSFFTLEDKILSHFDAN